MNRGLVIADEKYCASTLSGAEPTLRVVRSMRFAFSVVSLLSACAGSPNSGAALPGAGGAGGARDDGGVDTRGGGASTSGAGPNGGATANGGAAAASGSANAGKGGASGGSGGDTGACDPTSSSTNRTLVGSAIDQLFVQKDITAVDRYWADPYYQHNPLAMSGVAAFRSLMSSFITASTFSYQRLLTLADCDLVVVLGDYSQTGVIFDMFRVQGGKIMEHWDSDSNQASETTGLVALDTTAPTAANRALFDDFAATVLVGADSARVSDFLSATYVEHHGTRATGPGALSAYLQSESVSYAIVHYVIADGNFVFALSEGKRGTASFGFYDLFRIDSGKIAEHWDSRRAVPASTASGLAIF